MRPIDADALPVNFWDGRFVGVAKNDLDKAPTLDVRPNIYAHWVKGGYTFVGVHRVDEYICSRCDYHTLEAGTYCGKCGAIMDEGAGECVDI